MPMKESNPSIKPIGQNLIKLISNLCFSVFVFSVLIFTVIAITYQTQDPWLELALALTKLFIETESATFKNNNSILKMGEDFSRALSPALSPVDSTTTEEVIEKEAAIENLTLPKLNCEDLEKVNCSDPRALTVIEMFNLRVFKLIMFLDYRPPVNGLKPDECDVSWRFRNKKEKSWRKYRDFRRFKLGKLHLQSESRKEKEKAKGIFGILEKWVIPRYLDII